MAQTLADYSKNPPPIIVELCGCGCGKPLEKNDPLGPYWVGTGDNKVLINEDCYFDRISDEIDKHPIGGLGIHGPKNNVPESLDDAIFRDRIHGLGESLSNRSG